MNSYSGSSRDPSPVSIPDLLGHRAAGSLWLSLGLAGVLVPAWIASGATFEPDVHLALGSPWLPAALALLLSVRAGGLNLGVWGVLALGAVMAWWNISAGMAPPIALLLALGIGIAAGAAMALLTAGLNWLLARWMQAGLARWTASVIACGAVGAVTLMSAESLAAGAALKRLRLESIGGYNSSTGLVLLSAMFLVMTLAALAMIDRRLYAHLPFPPAHSPRLALTAALVGGGALAAVGGAIMLLTHSEIRPGIPLVLDLRIVLAVLLAGGWVWRGRGSAILSAAMLPLGMLVATIWREIVPLPAGLPGVPPLLAPIVLVAGLQCVLAGHRYRLLRGLAAGACALGIGLIAASSHWLLGPQRCQLMLCGLVLWFAGMALGFFRYLRRRAAAPSSVDPSFPS